MLGASEREFRIEEEQRLRGGGAAAAEGATGVGIGAVIVNEKGEMLLAKRGKKARNEHGKWEFPGGGVEFGDTMAETIVREMKEELGIEIELFAHLSPIDHVLHNEKQHWVTSVFISKIVNGSPTIKEPEKCDEIVR